MTNTEDRIEQLIDLRKLTFTGEAKTLRMAAGLTLSEMAGAINVNPSTLWRWENAKRSPKGAKALRYYKLLRKVHDTLGS